MQGDHVEVGVAALSAVPRAAPMAAELTAFVRWYVGDTDELPTRVANVVERHS